jgi:hypothetical protein
MCAIAFGRQSMNRFTTCLLGLWIIASTAGCGDKNGEQTSGDGKSNAESKASAQANSGDSRKSIETPSAANTTDRQADATDPIGAKKPAEAKPTNVQRAELDDTPRKPATVEEAQGVLDLTTFPLPEGAETGGERAIAHVAYRIAGVDSKSAFNFVRGEFTRRGWKEIGETSTTENGASGTFGGQGFVARVSAYPDSTVKDSKAVKVSITNQGNLNLAKLPVPPGAKHRSSGATSVQYTTELSPDEATKAVHKLLTEQGWTPYGDNIGAKHYKQNAILLMAPIGKWPNDNKTMISYLASLMSADLPAPPQALEVTYTDHMPPPKQLLFETAAARDEIYQFYRDTLAKDGWAPTTEKPITDQYKAFMIFRNQAKDLMELATENPQEGKIRGNLKHQSAAEVAEIERKIKAERPRLEAELKKKREEEEAKEGKLKQDRKDKEAAEKARRRVVVAIPADAKDVKFDADAIQFGVAPGKARAAAESIAKQIRAAGWKEDKPPKDATLGIHTFKKDDQSVYIHYSDPRSAPPDVRVSGFRVDFEKAEPAKK